MEKKKYVFFVNSGHYDTEDWIIEAIFSTEELAITFVAGRRDLEITKHELDAATDSEVGK